MEEKIVKVDLELTEEEASYLTIEMNNILREFGMEPYNGRHFTNPVMAAAFNKLFKALTGQDHHNCVPSKMEEMEAFHNRQGR